MKPGDATPARGPRITGETLPDGVPVRRCAERDLARIEAALARMSHGRYGFCLTCDSQIGLPRLEADPAEALCADCAETVPA
ncbi:MAG: TraR/DksA C4-type zinc finger protein [Hyphomonas sp.]|uniref:TraR/DksA family transcriptional regulator n=1 Tax=Hyphomonas sp. TaxID=87 RepID=UPI0035277D85